MPATKRLSLLLHSRATAHLHSSSPVHSIQSANSTLPCVGRPATRTEELGYFSSNPNVARPSVLHTACSKVHMIVVQSTSNASKYVCVRRAAAIVIILIALAVVSSPRASALSRKSFCHLDWRVSCLEPKETDVEPEETGPMPCVTKLMVSRNPACYGTTFPVCDGSPGRSPNSHTQHRP